MDSKQGDSHPFINASYDLLFLVPPSFGCRERNVWEVRGGRETLFTNTAPLPKVTSSPSLSYYIFAGAWVEGISALELKQRL